MKLRTGLICLILMLLVCFAAQAANRELLADIMETNGYLSVRNVVSLGDDIYVLYVDYHGDWTMELYRCSVSKGTEEKLGEVADALGYYDESVVNTHTESLDMEHAVSYLFTDGTRLLSMNPKTGRIFSITPKDGVIVYEDIVDRMDDEGRELIEEIGITFDNAYDTFMLDERLFICCRTWDDRTGNESCRICGFSLADGSMTETSLEHVQALSIGKNGEILAALQDWSDYDPETGEFARPQLCTVDPLTGETELIQEVPISYLSNMLYDPELDRLVYSEGSRIMALSEDGEITQVGFLPGNLYATNLVKVPGSVLVWSWNGIFLRSVSLDFRSDRQVTTYSYYQYDATRKFFKEHPDIPVYENDVYYSGADKLLEAMKNGDMDLLCLSVNYTPFTVLRDHGYCENLDDNPTVRSFVDRLYAVYQAEATYRDHLVAVPISSYSYDGLSADMEALEEVGLTEDDLPTNMVELCEFITMWNDEYADDWPDYTPLLTYRNLKGMIMEQIITSYMNYCMARGEIISFSTPLFRELMNAVENMHTDKIPQAPDIEEYGYGDDDEAWDAYYSHRELLHMYYTMVGSFSNFEDMKPRMLPLTSQTEPYTFVSVQMVCINPWSAHKEEARMLLDAVIETLMGTETEYVLCKDMTEPLENPNFDEMVSYAKEALAMWQDTLDRSTDEDEETRELAQTMAAAYEEELASMDRYRYTVSEESLQWYQESIAASVRVAQRTFMNNSENDANAELSSLMNRFVDGQIGIDQFIREADGKLRMMQLEDQ